MTFNPDPEIMLSDLARNLAESETLKMARMARELKAQGHDVISLSLGEPDFDTPEHIKEAAYQALQQGYTKYTPVAGLPELVDAIVYKFKRDNNLHFQPPQIVVSNGAKQTIYNLCQALINPGDEVVVFTPYWVSYVEIIRMAGGVPVCIYAGVDKDFKVQADQVARALTPKTKMVLFSSPCNPTGSVFSRAELSAIADVVAQHDKALIVSDEIYEYINFAGQHVSIGSLPQVAERTITVNGFAKGFSMTGWRLGYMGGPQWVAAACNKIQGQVTSGASSFGQKAAAVALMSDLAPTHAMRAAFMARRDLVIELFSGLPHIVCNRPQGAFYLFADVSGWFGATFVDFDGNRKCIKNSDDFCDYIMMHAHVGLVSGAAFGDPRCFRLSYAASEDQLREAARRIGAALEKLSLP